MFGKRMSYLNADESNVQIGKMTRWNLAILTFFNAYRQDVCSPVDGEFDEDR